MCVTVYDEKNIDDLQYQLGDPVKSLCEALTSYPIGKLNFVNALPYFVMYIPKSAIR